jgi:hypothetical protein
MEKPLKDWTDHIHVIDRRTNTCRMCGTDVATILARDEDAVSET